MLTNEQKAQRLCSVKGCLKKHNSHGYCGMHFHRIKKHGDPDMVLKTNHNHIDRVCIINGCEDIHKAKGYCNKHYQAFNKYGDALHKEKLGQPRKFKSVFENFESRFTKGSDEECWEWEGVTDKDGYGELSVWMQPGYKKYRATRLSIQFYKGDLVDDLLVCHKCDNPSCVNPKHLFQGTPQDNATDMVNKKRSMVGERNNKAKLSIADVLYIRNSGKKTMELVRELGVNRSTILNIRKVKTWRHSC